MDPSEAARLLGVADSEVVEVRDVGGRFEVLHHDMASHEETWREVPGSPELALERDSGVVEPDAVPDDQPVVVEDPAPKPKRRSAR